MKGKTLNTTVSNPENESKHTPGPWALLYVQNSDEIERITIHTQTSMGLVKDIICKMEGSNIKEANARLIAAAPDMLEAANAALTDWHSKDSNFYKKEPAYLEMLRKAIRKATKSF